MEMWDNVMGGIVTEWYMWYNKHIQKFNETSNETNSKHIKVLISFRLICWIKCLTFLYYITIKSFSSVAIFDYFD